MIRRTRRKRRRGRDDETPQERKAREKEAKRVCTIADSITSKLGAQKATEPLQRSSRRARGRFETSGAPLYWYTTYG